MEYISTNCKSLISMFQDGVKLGNDNMKSGYGTRTFVRILACDTEILLVHKFKLFWKEIKGLTVKTKKQLLHAVYKLIQIYRTTVGSLKSLILYACNIFERKHSKYILYISLRIYLIICVNIP